MVRGCAPIVFALEVGGSSSPYVDPHVGDLLIDHEGLCGARHGLGPGPPLSVTACDRDEQGRWEENQLQPLLGPVQEHGPSTAGQRGITIMGMLGDWAGPPQPTAHQIIDWLLRLERPEGPGAPHSLTV